MVNGMTIMDQLLYRMTTGKPVLFGEYQGADETKIYDKDLVSTPTRSVIDSVVIETSKLSAIPLTSPPYNNELGSIIGSKRCKRTIDMKIPFFFPSHMPIDEKEDHLLGVSLGCVLSGMPISVQCNGFGDMMRELISSYNPQTIFKWPPDISKFDLDLLKRSNGVEIIISKNNPLPVPDIMVEKNKTYVRDPAVHPSLRNGKDLRDMVNMIRQVNDGPIIGTISASDITSDLDYLLISGVDCVHIICGNGITLPSGAADPYSRDILPTLVEAEKHLRTFLSRKEGMKLIVSGPFLDANDIVKAMCLGADNIGLDFAISRSLSLINRGYLSEDPEGKGDVGWDMIGEYINNLILSFKRELVILLGALGDRKIKDLTPEMLRSTTYDSAAVTGLKLIGYDEKLGMWKH